MIDDQDPLSVLDLLCTAATRRLALVRRSGSPIGFQMDRINKTNYFIDYYKKLD
jgi:hypothetical protein